MYRHTPNLELRHSLCQQARKGGIFLTTSWYKSELEQPVSSVSLEKAEVCWSKQGQRVGAQYLPRKIRGREAMRGEGG